MAMPGELLVPTPMVQAGAVDHLRGKIPGFAAGGIVPSYRGAVPGVYPWWSRDANANVADDAWSMAQAYLSVNKTLTSKLGSGGVPVNVQSYASTVLRVLSMLGQPSSDLGVVLRQMTTESGGNPTIVNKWDSNWLAGHPSVGLMQVIAGTFDAYAGPYRNLGPFEYGVSVNPLANIYAGLNYAISRYGYGWPLVLGQGHGYDSGGLVPPGARLIYNGTGRPEAMLPPGATEALMAIASGGGGGSAPLIGTYAPVYQDIGSSARALGDLAHQLAVARMSNYSRVRH